MNRDSSHETKSEVERFRLDKYYYSIEISTLILLVIAAAIVYFFKQDITWLRYPNMALWLLVAIFIYNLIFFILHQVYKKNIFFSFTRYGFVVFFILVLYTTENILSPFLILLLFPLVVSAVDLNAKATRAIGILITISYALLIFADPIYLKDTSTITAHVLRVAFLGLISYYMYKIVKETLRQKYEKEEANKKFVELSELDRIKTDFLTVAEHQLRTPITAVKWGISNLLEDNNSTADKTILKELQGKIEDSIKIVDDMLKTVDYGLETFHLNIAVTDLSLLIGKIVSDFHNLADTKNVQIQYVPHTVMVKIDNNLMTNAISNVIENAIRYSPNGIVHISLSQEENRAVITITDNGIGIDEESIPYIFERFYRSKKAISIDPNESGVGLYITKKIVELHGGQIEVKSKENKGTTVTITMIAIDNVIHSE